LTGLTEILRVQTSGGEVLGRITASGPSPLEVESPPDPNDLSAVFRIATGGTTFLVAGDATLERWRDAVSQWDAVDDPLQCDGLLLPHNGSRHSMDREILLQITKPTGFLAAVAPHRIYRLPDPDVVESVQRLGGHLVRVSDRPIHLVLSFEGLFHRVAPNSNSDGSKSAP
jgi:beta-lactamase superfamily II metal-dependent hydrolase